MHRFRIPFSLELIVCNVLAACIGTALAGNVEPGAGDQCQIGAYRLPDGEIVDIARSEGNTFRWRKFDGSTGVLHQKEGGSRTSRLGWTDRPDGHAVSFSGCANGEIEFDGKKARRIPFDVTDTVFVSRGGVKFACSLGLSKCNEIIPIVGCVH